MTGSTPRAAGLIVVGVDRAEASQAAVRWAAQEASWCQARVHLDLVCLRYRRSWYAGTPENRRGLRAMPSQRQQPAWGLQHGVSMGDMVSQMGGSP